MRIGNLALPFLLLACAASGHATSPIQESSSCRFVECATLFGVSQSGVQTNHSTGRMTFFQMHPRRGTVEFAIPAFLLDVYYGDPRSGTDRRGTRFGFTPLAHLPLTWAGMRLLEAPDASNTRQVLGAMLASPNASAILRPPGWWLGASLGQETGLYWYRSGLRLDYAIHAGIELYATWARLQLGVARTVVSDAALELPDTRMRAGIQLFPWSWQSL